MRRTYVPERLYPFLMGFYHPDGGAGLANNWQWASRDPAYCNNAESLVGSKGPGWHSCSHSKCSVLMASGPTWIAAGNDASASSTWFEYSFQGYAASVGACADADRESVASLPTTSVLGTLHYNAMKAMLPGVKSEMSLPNSIYELKDIMTARRTAEKIRRAVLLLQRYGLGSKTLRGILRSGADIFLQQEFNIKPLVRDISTLWRCLHTYSKTLNKLKSDVGKVRKRHYKVSVLHLFPASEMLIEAFPCDHIDEAYHAPRFGSPILKEPGGAEYIYPPCAIYFVPGYLQRYRTERCVSAEYTATVDYSFSLSSYGDGPDGLMVLADSLGVNLNPAIIWNAIPWTFVVDWVLGVSKYLETFKVSWVQPTVTIHNTCWSIKRRTLVEYSSVHGASAHVPARPWTVCVRKECKNYDRFVTGSLTPHRPLLVDKLDIEETILAAALFLAR